MSTSSRVPEFAKKVPLGAEAVASRRSSASPTKVKDESISLMLKDPDRHARASIGCTEVGAKVYAQIWEPVTKEHAKWLSTLTADHMPSDKEVGYDFRIFE
jgi:hypothetical protein